MASKFALESDNDDGLVSMLHLIVGKTDAPMLTVLVMKLNEQAAQLDQMRQFNEATKESIMKTLDEVLTKVRESNTRADSVIELLNGFKAKLAEALKGERLSPESQAKINTLFDEASAQSDELVAAVEANTPPSDPAPAPAPAPADPTV